MSAPADLKFVASNRRVREDRRFVAGHATYVADMKRDGMLHVALVPSQHPAARIVSIDGSAALAMPGVHFVLTGAELAAAVAAAHRRGLRITGHLCSVSWPEAIAAGIDDLEHGPVYTDSEFVADRQADKCPEAKALTASWMGKSVTDPGVAGLIRSLVVHQVAVTSTLPVFELTVPGRPPVQRRALDAMSSAARDSYLIFRAQLDPADPAPARLFRTEMEFERAFVKAGGLLLAGLDPTGIGGTIAGFGDWRELELLVEAGFTPLESIKMIWGRTATISR